MLQVIETGGGIAAEDGNGIVLELESGRAPLGASGVPYVSTGTLPTERLSIYRALHATHAYYLACLRRRNRPLRIIDHR